MAVFVAVDAVVVAGVDCGVVGIKIVIFKAARWSGQCAYIVIIEALIYIFIMVGHFHPDHSKHHRFTSAKTNSVSDPVSLLNA
ncbi:hypothetical protein Q8A64_14695 [Oxalobacteraceae bacterium R-40]|uniref:Uncharacterized protein n=1 Tax=Keguizhuia sedimenti TaxID=3064264 RepID=A0ABU1BS07_9BURK|nr:hypothetical protein [Oxalobacteraceae bacterium R-40]